MKFYAVTINVTTKPVTFLHETNNDLGQFDDGTFRGGGCQCFIRKKCVF